MLGMSIRTSRRSARRGRIRPLQTVEIGSDLFSTIRDTHIRLLNCYGGIIRRNIKC